MKNKELTSKFNFVAHPFEPITVNRFYVSLSEDLDIDPEYITCVDLPKCTIDKNEIKWLPIQLKFVENCNNPVTNKIIDWVNNKNKVGQNIAISLLDPVGSEIVKWKLYNCMVTFVNFGTGNYDKSDLQFIELTIQPENCEASIKDGLFI